MALITDGIREKADVELMIESMGTLATHYRPTKAGTGSFAGGRVISLTDIGDIHIEMLPYEPTDPVQTGADANANTKADSGVLEDDVLTIAAKRYRVIDVKEQNFFGTITHLSLKLMRLKEHA